MTEIVRENQCVTAAVLRHRNGERFNSSGHDASEADKALIEAMNDAGFHWRHGIYFKRLHDGGVRVRHFTDWNYQPTWHDWIIPAAEWASIVASVSAGGETAERYSQALSFHSDG